MTPTYNEELNNALRFMLDCHAGQYRKESPTGILLPYMTHPIAVMQLVWKWGCGSVYVMVGCANHDVKEDCLIDGKPIPQELLISKLGVKAATLVDELSCIPPEGISSDDKKKFKENYLASFANKSIESVIVKLADRFVNVFDFMLTDPKYARKYFDKAQPLFDIFFDRINEIEIEFGKRSKDKMIATYLNVKNTVLGVTSYVITPM